MSEDRKRCFVIMPFSQTTVERTEDYWTKHYERFLKPLIEECSTLEAHRSKPLRGSIVGRIIADLVKSSVVVADLTDANPNVYWELGVRHSFRHGTILIAQDGTELPFDIKDTGTLFYDPDHLDVDVFRNNFKAAIVDCLENSNRTDSYVLETLSGRGALYEIIRREETLSRLDAVLSECKYNRFGLESIIKQVQSNRDDPQNSKIVTASFRLRAAELLATNRYIDEDQSFYIVVENYLDILTMMNTQLELWAHPDFGNSIEESLLKQGRVATKVSETFQDKVETKVFEAFEYRIVDVLCHHEPVRKNSTKTELNSFHPMPLIIKLIRQVSSQKRPAPPHRNQLRSADARRQIRCPEDDEEAWGVVSYHLPDYLMQVASPITILSISLSHLYDFSQYR